MALSNTVREPRRELTESGLGLLIATPFVVLAYFIAAWAKAATPWMQFNDPMLNMLHWLLAFIFAAIVIGLGVWALKLIHDSGELFCNAMQARGIHLRPRERLVNGRWVDNTTR